MKPSTNLIDSLANMESVTTQGDLRRIVANSLLALARKEISATDVQAMGKGLESINNSLLAEIKVAKMAIELRTQGGELGKVVELGNLVIGNKPNEVTP